MNVETHTNRNNVMWTMKMKIIGVIQPQAKEPTLLRL